MSTAKNAKPAAQAAPLWTALRRSDLDASAPLTLFDMDAVDNSMNVRKPDRCGTPDLFSDWA
jgi:hypothetical protein